jgi:hypothetical protein
LCAAYTDLDFYNPGMTDQDVITRLAELQQQGVIPRPSLLVHSGRGIWVLWLLRDENDPDLPPRATKYGLELKQHREIQAALHQRFTHLGADKKASSPAGYIRLPGSLDSKSETHVSWEIQVDETCHTPRYTLSQLTHQLAISPATASVKPKPKVAGTAQVITVGKKRGRAGWEALRARRLSDFRKLWRIRKRFSGRCRKKVVFYYATLLAQAGMRLEKAKVKAGMLNGACRPPLKESDVDAAVQSAYSKDELDGSRKYKRLRDQTIANWLEITPNEASSLKCKATAAHFNLKTDAPVAESKRAEKDAARITGRHTAIIQIVSDAGGHVPSSRKMAAALKARGLGVGYVTVTTDYECLEIKIATNSKTNKAASKS